jgi:hypothetical protein
MASSYNGDPFCATNRFVNVVNMANFLDKEQNVPSPVPAHQQQQAAGPGQVKLPEFLPHAPGIWFARAEFNLEVSGITSYRNMLPYVTDTHAI